MTAIYVDADACPVKNEIYRVAERYGLKVYVVSNSWLGVPRDPRVELVVVSDGFDAADAAAAIAAVRAFQTDLQALMLGLSSTLSRRADDSGVEVALT